ncbi:hypothetical protein [Streptomyces mirabilis]|uniref:hypothetical protein n=1 Tax=Streptomyces mirabilis TaxID=68239 RepID=UPI0036DE7EE6
MSAATMAQAMNTRLTLDATRADINAAYRSKQGGGHREVDLHRGAHPRAPLPRA